MTMALYQTYLSDPEMEHLCGDAALLGHVAGVEIALAEASAEAGLIAEPDAREIRERLAGWQPEASGLSAGTARHGIPLLPWLAAARARLSPAAAQALHHGATSQDILDNAYLLMTRRAMALLEERMRRLEAALQRLQLSCGALPMVGRTRGQHALPMALDHKLEAWRAPLLRQQQRLDQLKPRLLRLQLGGAVGTRQAWGQQGSHLSQALARRLALHPAFPWHSQRDTWVEWGQWLGLLSSHLGKVGQDLLLMAQSEVAEVRLPGGASSAMPHKQNPVGAEALLALARWNLSLLGGLQQAQLHAHERDGSGLALEWLSLPQMMTTTAASLRHALELTEGLTFDAAALRRPLEAQGGRLLGSLARQRLHAELPPEVARASWQAAQAQIESQPMTLAQALNQVGQPPGMDWEAYLQPENHLGERP